MLALITSTAAAATAGEAKARGLIATSLVWYQHN